VEICDEKCIKDSVKQNKKVHINVLGSDLCYHFPTWYLLAAYNQLPANTKKPNLVPSPLSPPRSTDEACSPFNVARGTSNNPAYLANATAQGIATTAGQAADEAAKAAKAAADAAAKAAAAAAKAAADAAAKAAADAAKTAQDIIKGLNYTVNVIADNANGRAIPEGKYVFRANRGTPIHRHRQRFTIGTMIKETVLQNGMG
jgi:multidrug efflux pump subunit AcrA (membrane-fusion protein)